MTSRMVLLPDLDGELEHVLCVLDEVLIALHTDIDDECDADPTGESPAELDQLGAFHHPGACDDPFARIWRSVRDAGERPGRVFAPGGRHEHLPLRVIRLATTDIHQFGQTVATLGRLVDAGDTSVTEVIVERAGGRRPNDMMQAWARAHMLLGLTDAASTALLAAELGDGTSDVTLSLAGEACYQSTADRLVRLYHGSSALDRYLY